MLSVIRARRRGRARTWLAACLGALAVGAPSVRDAQAGPYATLGYDAETAAVANSAIGYGRSLGVLHTNPALLPSIDAQGAVTLLVVAPSLHVNLMKKPRSTDVPISIYDSTIGTTPGIQDRALPTIELPSARSDNAVDEPSVALGSGLATDLGLPGFRLGVMAILPLSGRGAAHITTHYDDEREAAFSNQVHLTRFGEWDDILEVIAGAGYAVAPWLDVGVSAEIAASIDAGLRVYIPDAAVQDYAQTNFDAEISTKIRPIVGVRARPWKWLGVGLVWRNATYYEVAGESDVALWNSHEAATDKTIPKRSTQVFPAVFGYEPMEVALGASVHEGPVTAHLAGTWQRWSAYLDGHGVAPEDAAKPPPSPFPSPTVDASDYAFSDTIAVQGGASYRFRDDLETSLGAAVYPTPVPPQVGRTSYADSTIVGGTVGQRFDFQVMKRRFSVALALELWRMLPRTTHKDPGQIIDEFPDDARTLKSGRPMPEAAGLQSNNPGFPGYDAGGTLFSGALSVSHAF
jgi:hypothetical protein